MEVNALETIRTLRSMRQLKADPVEPEKVRIILEAAGKAPSGGNTQPWEFIVITDSSLKKRIREVAVQGLKARVSKAICHTSVARLKHCL